MPTLRRCSFAIPAFLALAAAARSQGPTAGESAGLLPLHAGTRWIYTVTDPDRPPPPSPRRIEVVDEGRATLPDGERVAQWRVETPGAPPRFEWWSVHDDGIRHRFARDAARRGAFDAEATPMLWLRLPPTAGNRWTWTGRHDVASDDQGRPFTHQAECVATDERITVPAGRFVTTHVRVDSAFADRTLCTRELWFAPGVGIVRDLHRDATGAVQRDLVAFQPASPDRDARLRQFLERELAKPGTPAWNNPPGVRWLEGGAELLLVPGSIAVAEGEHGSTLYYVGEKDIVRFRLEGADNLILAAREAFGADTAVPPEHVPVAGLALLLARAEAHRRGMERVHPVPVTLEPPRKLPTESHRQAAVQVAGGARDGTTRNVAVWLTVRRFSNLQLVTDFAPPPPAGR